MKHPARIDIVTIQEADRYELIGSGSVSFDNTDAVYVTFLSDKTEMLIGLSHDTATLTCLGEDGYTLVAQQNRAHPVELAGQTFTVVTDKLRYKKSEHRIDLMIAYRLIAGEYAVNNKLILKCTF